MTYIAENFVKPAFAAFRILSLNTILQLHFDFWLFENLGAPSTFV